MKKCKSEIWKLDDFRENMFPKYKTTVRWSSQQRKNLFKTIKNNSSFGNILLYESSSLNGNACYQIMDGVQRVLTIKHISEHRKYYYDDFDFNQFFSLLNGCCYNATEQREILLRNMNCDEKNFFIEQTWKTFEICQDSSQYSQSLFSRIRGFCSDDKANAVCEALFNKFNKDFNPNDIDIPVTICSGNIDIFMMEYINCI